ncbi:sterol desaturase family protein [Solimonas marina]|uniref:Sterol desaturase family protein n=1 Tax=Solimonas marina TaxID=2714601 RepID=A0A969WDI6_9GAMM|nr:sterol desaturase family protein [Solimonas marina]NKF24214.1 sterol desaturase family protein [Solimonas marina]
MVDRVWQFFAFNPQHLRLLATAAILGLVFAAEALWPRRAALRGRRWPINFALLIAAGLMLSLIPVAAVGVASWAHAHGLGLFNVLHVPAWLETAVAIIVLDASMYWQHRSMHGPAWLWRLHRVHHSDVEFDATTALRFHPLEMLATSVWKWATVLLLGASPLAVVLFEAITGMYSLFIHSNLHVPAAIDRVWRRVFVTPDLHRIHHSVDFDEGNRNFGTIFSCWDRWFASHCAQPRDGHDDMQIGLPEFRAARDQSLTALLLQPLRTAEPPPAAGERP